MKLALSTTIADIDSFSAKNLGIPVVDLMKKSGEAVADTVRKRVPLGTSVVILAGKGNNGGDGYAAAVELLKEYSVTVYDVFSKGQKTSAGKHFLELYKSLGGAVVNYQATEQINSHIKNAGCIVDAIFGTGFTGDMPQDLLPLAITVREAVGAHKIAIDVPLGINADNGCVNSFVFSVEATVALSYIKPGILSYPARAYVGEIVYASLGLPNDVIEQNFDFKYELVDEDFAAVNLPKRELNSSKGSFGKLLVIAGSERYHGAAHLALEAALRGGVGYVSYLGISTLVNELRQKFPEAIYKESRPIELLTDDEISEICKLSSANDATLIGSGSDNTEGLLRLTKALIDTEGGALILDADAINALSSLGADTAAGILKAAKREIILTPHPLEFARLLGIDVATVQLNRLDTAVKFAKRNKLCLVLKGAGTVVTDGSNVIINSSGSSSLAKAGSGDVLAGFLSAMIAQKSNPVLISSALSVYIHASAADALASEYSDYGVTPSDLPRQIARQILLVQKHMQK